MTENKKRSKSVNGNKPRTKSPSGNQRSAKSVSENKQGPTRLTLSNLKPARGSRRKHVRVGRGMGSKLGKTAGKGNKGQQSRRGYSRRRGFEGGQMPLHRRMPKRGFTAPFKRDVAIVNVETLNLFESGATVGMEELRHHGLVRGRRDGVKILGSGDLKVALTVRAHAFSKSAQEKINGAGGTAEILS